MLVCAILIFTMTNPNKLSPKSNKLTRATAAAAIALSAMGVGSSVAGASPKTNRSSSPVIEKLDRTIAGLEAGKSATVTANEIAVPGPVNRAEARPLVIEVGKNTYFAYTQEAMPNFNQKSPADVAGDMAIVKEPAKDANIPLESAHLNKLGGLVNANQETVGFSTGGDSTGK